MNIFPHRGHKHELIFLQNNKNGKKQQTLPYSTILLLVINEKGIEIICINEMLNFWFLISVCDQTTDLPQSASSSSLEQTFTSPDQMSPSSARQSRGRKVQSAIWHKGRDSLIFFQLCSHLWNFKHERLCGSAWQFFCCCYYFNN